MERLGKLRAQPANQMLAFWLNTGSPRSITASGNCKSKSFCVVAGSCLDHGSNVCVLPPPPLPTALVLVLLASHAALSAPSAPVFQRDLGDSRVPQVVVPFSEAGLTALGGESFTVPFRLRLPSNSADTTLAVWQTADRKQGFRLHSQNGKDAAKLEFEAAFDWKHARNDRPLRLVAPLRVFRPGDTHDVVVSFTGAKLSLSLDGVLMDEEWPVGRVALPSTDSLSLAAGTLQKVTLWDRALSDQEIVQISGGEEQVAGREREILGPPRPLTQ